MKGLKCDGWDLGNVKGRGAYLGDTAVLIIAPDFSRIYRVCYLELATEGTVR